MIIFELAGLIAILAGILFMQRRLPADRRRRARRQAATGTAVLAAILGLSWAQQMLPARPWPTHEYWTTGLFQEPDGSTYCFIHASGPPGDGPKTMNFGLIQTTLGTAVTISTTATGYEIRAPKITFASDGFAAMNIDAHSSFSRFLNGKMGNEAAAKLEPDQWARIWGLFRNSGVVTVETEFILSHFPTEGFEAATADFSQCLGQLNLITGQSVKSAPIARTQ